MAPTAPETEAGERSCWNTDYWLRHCEGYRVWEPSGPIGRVEAVLTTEDGEPHSLVVRVGSSFSVLVTFPVDAVEGIDFATERVFLGSTVPAAEQEGRQLVIPACV
jgi:hypothetical protein